MSKIFGQALLDDMVRTDSLPMPLVKQAAKEILAVIREGLMRDGVVKVSNFGTFRLKPVAARQGVNPQTGKTITIPAQQRVIFTPCKALRNLIQPVYRPPQPIESQPSPRLDTGNEATPIEVKESGVMPGSTVMQTRGSTRPSETSPVPHHQQPPAPSLRVTSRGVTEMRVPVEPDTAPLPAALASHSDPVTDDRENPATMAIVKEVPASESPIEPPCIPQRGESTLQPPSPKVSSVRAATEQAEPEAENPGLPHRYTLSATVILLIALVGIGMLRFNSEESAPRQAVATPHHQPESRPASTIAEAEAPSPTPLQAVASEPVANTDDDEPNATVNLTQLESRALEQSVAPGLITERQGEDGTENNPGIESVPSSPIPAKDYYFIERSHEIANGESLWRLARHHYRDPLLWPHIYQANTTRIDNPDHLLVGSTITIPGLQGSPDRLTRLDRKKIAEGYYLAYLHYKNIGREDALFALLEAKRYDNNVVESYRSQMQLSQADALQLMLQPTMPF